MAIGEIVEADLTWTGARFESGIQVAVGDEGRITRVGRLGLPPTLRLEREALLPGFVNAHSHAFQRGLRGRGERFPAGAGSFWTWREAMYDLVERLDAQEYSRLCVQAFSEMRDAGITTVCEFHYFHHSPGKDDFAFDTLTLEAAKEAGVRIALLQTFYATGAIGKPLGPGQRRFRTDSLDGYWDQLDRLERIRDPQTQSLGVVAHSVRAVPVPEIIALHGGALQRGLPFHMHVEEQRKEIEECLAAYGQRPMELLTSRLDIQGNLTAVHCTHTTPDDMNRFLAAGGRICACPLTEGNLGDGIQDWSRVPVDRFCLGSDSNLRIALIEEMRWLEYGQRLRHQQRGALTDAAGEVAPALLRAATLGGAEALGVEAGAIETGRLADFAAIDLEHPALVGCGEDSLLQAITFGADNGVVTRTAVGGSWRDTAAHR